MSCAVDPSLWGDANRVSLATGKTHEWVLARTSRDKPTMDSVVTTARAVMSKWFEGTALDVQFADAGDAVDAIRILSVESERPAPEPGEQRREQCNPIPTLAASETPPIYVRVSFNYRGYAQSLPWPVWTASSSPFRADKLCPLGADWMLSSARAIRELPAAPPKDGLLERLSENAVGPLSDMAQLTRLAGWALLAWASVQVVTVLRAASASTYLPRGRA